MIIFSSSFKKSFKKLSPKINKRFKERLELFLSDPNHPTLHKHPLHGNYQGYWSINITGDIRAVFKKVEDTTLFIDIGTHSELYE